MSLQESLETYLAPFQEVLDDATVNEILFTREGVLHVERNGYFDVIEIPELTFRYVRGLVTLIGRFTEQHVHEEKPLLSAKLPSGHRVQAVLPPATESDRLILVIRKQTLTDSTLDDLAASGCFTHTQSTQVKLSVIRSEISNPMKDEGLHYYYQNDWVRFLKWAMGAKKNIVICGATSTGKTTFLNACLKEIPDTEHIVTLEDVAELRPPHRLHTPLYASKGQQGLAKLSMSDLLQASLRLRPDRIILGELRGPEAMDFINAASTGHEGSITSLHAASPMLAFLRLVHLMKQGGNTLSKDDILWDLVQVVDIMVQLKRTRLGKKVIRHVSDMYYADAKPC